MNHTTKTIRAAIHKAQYAKSDIQAEFLKRLEQPPYLRESGAKTHFCVFFLPLVLKTKEIFLIHHKKANQWISPGGHIDRHESPKDTIVREFQEELRHTIHRTDIPAPFYLTIKHIEKKRSKCSTHYDIWYVIKLKKIHFQWCRREFFDAQWINISHAIKKTNDPQCKEAFGVLCKHL